MTKRPKQSGNIVTVKEIEGNENTYLVSQNANCHNGSSTEISNAKLTQKGAFGAARLVGLASKSRMHRLIESNNQVEEVGA